MARTASRKVSAWNKAVKAAFAKGAKNLKAAVAAAKKSYKPKAVKSSPEPSTNKAPSKFWRKK